MPRRSGLYGRTLGLLGVGSIGQEMIRRAAGFGMNVVVWSRRFDGQDRPMNEEEARELGVEPALRTVRIDACADARLTSRLAPTCSAFMSRWRRKPRVW